MSKRSLRARAGTIILPIAIAMMGVTAGRCAHRPDGADMQDRVILITGSTSGLGREVALRLAGSGTHIIVHGRDRARGEAVVREIEERGGSARFFAADFSAMHEVREFAHTIVREYDRLDVLINNAGVWVDSSEEAQLTVDGHELHFAVNYLSGFLLTRTLLPLLIESRPARIINVASAAQSPIDFNDVMLARNYSDLGGYMQSKLAQVMFTFDLADELRDSGVTVNALHPATYMNTPMVVSRGVKPVSSVSEGADAVINLVESPDVGTGQYFNGKRPGRANRQAYDATARARLRTLSLELIADHRYP